ncbi:MAG: hypothetical protein EHJ95_05255 [Methanobacteriota archaeon]|nr:MAG: hypothetical protein EHJ95_05255 [Euryarchaeota archaeon]
MSLEIAHLADEIKMIRVFLSCQTKEHYQSALEMAHLFAAKHNDEFFVTIILDQLKNFEDGSIIRNP